MYTQTFNSTGDLETQAFARDLAMVARTGDLITLNGDIGAGKTLFCRAFIRQYLQNPDMEIPSPTYLVSLEYQGKNGTTVTHMDLYRMSCPYELDELGLEEAQKAGIVLIEWPQLTLANLPSDRLDVSFEITGGETRILNISGNEKMFARYQRSTCTGRFARQHWPIFFSRHPLVSDASVRNYELLKSGRQIRVLMDAGKKLDKTPVKNNQPYHRIAHLAENIRPFIAIANLLREKGFAAPKVYAGDYEKGFALLEYLGHDRVTNGKNQPVSNRYIESGKLLTAIHAIDWPDHVKMEDNEVHKIPLFDEQAMLIEVELLVQWYLNKNEFSVSEENVREYLGIWETYARLAQDFRRSLVLRDYHSPNIIWREKKMERSRIGLLDFQDAMIGPAIYDLVSLAQDARVPVPVKLENMIVQNYLDSIRRDNESFNEEHFRFEYAMMGAQRASKLMGIFVRLEFRDGKPEYKKLIKNAREYLKRNLQHPQLSDYRQWCEQVIGL